LGLIGVSTQQVAKAHHLARGHVAGEPHRNRLAVVGDHAAPAESASQFAQLAAAPWLHLQGQLMANVGAE
jgi:hypothetical protein